MTTQDSAAKNERPPCAGLWNTPMVRLDGTLTTCCLDEAMENALGNLKEHSLQELWNGPTMNRWRIAQIEGRFQDSGPACSKCNWRSAGAYPQDKISEFQKRLESATLPPTRKPS